MSWFGTGLTLLATPMLTAAAGSDSDRRNDAGTLAPVVVSATRGERDPLEVAAAIDAIRIDTAATPSLGIHSSELLSQVVGVVARNRQNHAQDEQLSIRGFGARASFGVRGVRLYVDGVPASSPDGAGQMSHFNLDSAARIEVLRGPFSALYGNASGGVVQLFTADPSASPPWQLHSAYGRDSTARIGIAARGRIGDFGYSLGLTGFRTDGFREHSRARRQSGNAKLQWDPTPGRRLSVLLNLFDSPDSQDPLGLDRSQYRDNPRQAVPVATQFNTRKSVTQTQVGVVYEHELSAAQQLRLMAYGGRREVEQYLAIPPVAQANPTQAGGVIDLRGEYHGGDLRWRHDAEFYGRPLELTVGVSLDENDQLRRGYENFVGERLGVRGRLRRDEDNIARSFDQYVQASWEPAEAWSLSVGLRRSQVRFKVDDRYITAGNPDDSGAARHRATTPVLGVMHRIGERSRVYGNWGRAFETPTFAELGYRSDGGSGLNLDLQPARTRNLEIGYKQRSRLGIESQLALFRSDTRDEIAVATSTGGRSSFQNIGRARRQGLELGLTAPLTDRTRLRAGYTWLDARFRSPFLACTGGCTSPNTPVAAGASIPGVPRSLLFASLQWGEATGWQWTLESSQVAAVAVNDIGSERAPGHALFAASLGHGWRLPRGELRAFLRVDNLLDRRHVGAVIVNEGNGRFYEPGPGRGVLIGLQWRGD